MQRIVNERPPFIPAGRRGKWGTRTVVILSSRPRSRMRNTGIIAAFTSTTYSSDAFHISAATSALAVVTAVCVRPTSKEV